MADYPNLPDPDSLVTSATVLVERTYSILEHIALPQKRIELRSAADQVARELRERAT